MPVFYTVSHVYCKMTFFIIMNDFIIKIKSLHLLFTIFSFQSVHEYWSVCVRVLLFASCSPFVVFACCCSRVVVRLLCSRVDVRELHVGGHFL